jgi:hypothetical protein
MDVIEAIRTTGACRYFRPEPVPDDVLGRLFRPTSCSGTRFHDGSGPGPWLPTNSR